jgi:hypothetical protein
VATIGCDCHGFDRAGMALERRFGFPRRQVPNAQRVVVGAGDNVATIETSARPKPTTSMSHIAIAKSLDGKVVEWMNNGSDEQHEPKT